MGFVGLQEALRRELRRRVFAGELTGTELARKTGFTQAHISNFINRKRGLKLVALDRMAKALGLTVYDLLDPHELTRYVTLPETKERDFADVPVIDPSAAMVPVVVREKMREVLKFRSAFLERLRASGVAERKGWTRFVALQIEASEAAAMWPEATGRVTILVDRHYASLKTYRTGRRNVYAVLCDSSIVARYVERADGGLLLQPRDPGFPAKLLQETETIIVGRVAQASLKP